MDAWCHKNCNPQDVRHLDGVNTPICEQLFSSINKFTNAKSMNEANFFLFFLYIFDLHNLNIEGQLCSVANPLSNLRYEHITQSKKTPSDGIEEEGVENGDVANQEEVDDLQKMMQNMNVGDEKAANRDNSKDTVFKCDICGSEYKRLGYLKLHIKNKHEAESEAGYKCEVCGIKFDQVKHLNRHHKIHHSEIVCTLCNLEFRNKEVYDEHLNSQHVDCEVCGKKFETHNKLKRHVKTHK